MSINHLHFLNDHIRVYPLSIHYSQKYHLLSNFLFHLGGVDYVAPRSLILGTFRLDYEYEIEYEYDFRFSNQ